MGKTTTIGWCDSTRNFWLGCSKVHEVCPVTGKIHAEKGVCELCYVERFSEKFSNYEFGRLKKTNWNTAEAELKRWEPRKIFLNDFTDWLHPAISDSDRDEFISLLKRVNVAVKAKFGKLHQYQMLTKRVKKLAEFAEHSHFPDEFWIGVSIGNKPSLYYLNYLKQVRAKIRFISFEPLIEDLEDNDRAYRDKRFIDPKYNVLYDDVFDDEGLVNLEGIAWIIVGGESGVGARPMNAEWAEHLVTAGRKYGCAIFFKQLGGQQGNNAGGDILNGRTIKEFPKYG